MYQNLLHFSIFKNFLKKLHGIAPVNYTRLSKLETIEAGFFFFAILILSFELFV